MADFIEWQQFEHLDLFVKDNDYFNSVKISRDENYNIHFCVTCKEIKKEEIQEFSKVSSFYFSKLNSLTAVPNPFLGKEYVLNEFVTESFSFSPNDDLSISGIVIKVESHYITSGMGDSEFINIWLLNSPKHAHYDQNIIKTSSGNEHYKWGDFANEDFGFGEKYSASWAGIKLKYKKYDFLLIKSDIFTKFPSTCLRFSKNQFPNDNDLYEIINTLNFIFGMTFIYIGQTKYNCKSSPIANCYVSTYRKDIKQVLSEIQLPVIPLRLTDFHTFNVKTGDMINLVLKRISQNTKYNLFKNFAFINYARTQPIDVKIQPLAAAFDNICEKYFSDRENTIINADIFTELKSVIYEKIDTLSVDNDQKRILKSKTSQINNQSQNQRNKKIFEELGLNLSKLEEEALKTRNSSVHGGLNSKKINDMIRLSKCYYTLINRLLLRILDIPVYIDYTLAEGLPMKIEDGQYLWFERKEEDSKLSNAGQ